MLTDTSTGIVMRSYDEIRQMTRARLQGPPFQLSPGLAHIVATVFEPRTDGGSENGTFDARFRGERDRLMQELDRLVADNRHIPPEHLGGRIENIAEAAENRLRTVAEEAGAYEVVHRLERLDQERRTGLPDAVHTPDPGVQFDVSEVPRSLSGRRVGMWR